MAEDSSKNTGIGAGDDEKMSALHKKKQKKTLDNKIVQSDDFVSGKEQKEGKKSVLDMALDAGKNESKKVEQENLSDSQNEKMDSRENTDDKEGGAGDEMKKTREMWEKISKNKDLKEEKFSKETAIVSDLEEKPLDKEKTLEEKESEEKVRKQKAAKKKKILEGASKLENEEKSEKVAGNKDKTKAENIDDGLKTPSQKETKSEELTKVKEPKTGNVFKESGEGKNLKEKVEKRDEKSQKKPFDEKSEDTQKEKTGMRIDEKKRDLSGEKTAKEKGKTETQNTFGDEKPSFETQKSDPKKEEKKDFQRPLEKKDSEKPLEENKDLIKDNIDVKKPNFQDLNKPKSENSNQKIEQNVKPISFSGVKNENLSKAEAFGQNTSGRPSNGGFLSQNNQNEEKKIPQKEFVSDLSKPLSASAPFPQTPAPSPLVRPPQDPRPGSVAPRMGSQSPFSRPQSPTPNSGSIGPVPPKMPQAPLPKSSFSSSPGQISINPTTPFSGHSPNSATNAVPPKSVETPVKTPESASVSKEAPKEAPKTSAPITAEVVNKAPENAKTENETFEDFDSGESFFDVLAEAGISKTLFFWIVAGFLTILTAIVFFIFGGYSWIFGPDTGSDKPDDVVIEEVLGSESSVSGAIDIGEISSDSANLNGSLSGVSASFVLGDEYNSRRVDLVYYLKLLSEMQNVYRVDIYSYLDRNSQRRESLNALLDDMRTLLDEADKAIVAIDRTLTNLDASYTPMVDKRDAYEDMFFNSVDTFKGSEAYDNLEFFIEFSQDAVAVKAYFGAYSGILDSLEKMYALLAPRYDDIVVNKEALIKGIRVFDIPDSDIEAIIPLELQ